MLGDFASSDLNSNRGKTSFCPQPSVATTVATTKKRMRCRRFDMGSHMCAALYKKWEPSAAVAVFFAVIGIAAGLVFLLNSLTSALAPAALLLVVLSPLAKRVLPLPQAILGMAFGWGAIMAWSAVRNEIAWPAVGLFVATIFWAIGYDTIYALQDQEDDQRAGVHSAALLFGPWAWVAVGSALSVMMALLGLVGLATGLAWPFYVTALLTGVLVSSQARRIKTSGL